MWNIAIIAPDKNVRRQRGIQIATKNILEQL
jgi:hypothetical protein